METIQLTFNTSRGGTRLVSVSNPAPVVTQTTLDGAVERLVSANPFDETIGSLTELKRAIRVSVNRIPLIS